MQCTQEKCITKETWLSAWLSMVAVLLEHVCKVENEMKSAVSAYLDLNDVLQLTKGADRAKVANMVFLAVHIAMAHALDADTVKQVMLQEPRLVRFIAHVLELPPLCKLCEYLKNNENCSTLRCRLAGFWCIRMLHNHLGHKTVLHVLWQIDPAAAQTAQEGDVLLECISCSLFKAKNLQKHAPSTVPKAS